MASILTLSGLKAVTKLCEGYKTSLKTALDHTRRVFAKMDDCLPEDVKNIHPSEDDLKVEQKEMF